MTMPWDCDTDFRTGKWIWLSDRYSADSYARFSADFDCPGARADLTLCADGMFAVWCNGALCCWGKYPDYPHARTADRADLTPFLKPGKNRLAILVWYVGEDFSTYRAGPAGLIFEVRGSGGVIASSGPETLCAPAREYASGLCRVVTPQMGYSFTYDAAGDDGWQRPDAPCGGAFGPAVVVAGPLRMRSRPIARLELKDPLPSTPLKAGVFCGTVLPDGQDGDGEAETPEEQAFSSAEYAWQRSEPSGFPVRLGDRSPSGRGEKGNSLAVKGQGENDEGWAAKGTCLIVDLGGENCGFVDLEVETDAPCPAQLSWGEHLEDGRVRARMGGRRFCADLRLAGGTTRLIQPFRRLGCRYLQLQIAAPRATVNRLTLRPVVYPIVPLPVRFDDPADARLYATAVRTLMLCMHDHYEDTPWREQSLYAADSYIQLVLGLDAFGPAVLPYARASLCLLADGARPDGLLELCAPARVPITIPSFSLIYFLEALAYARPAEDKAFLRWVLPVLERCAAAFAEKETADGVLTAFDGAGYWNFYEWKTGLDGAQAAEPGREDAPLTAFYALALGALAEIYGFLDMPGPAAATEKKRRRVLSGFNRRFWDETAGAYCDYVCGSSVRGGSELCNALALLSGAVRGERRGRLADRLARPETGLTPVSLSHSLFLFQALLETDRTRYGETVLIRVRRVWGDMLEKGATSFWETEDGAADFDGAGSLCHGWSALPVYVLTNAKKFGRV